MNQYTIHQLIKFSLINEQLELFKHLTHNFNKNQLDYLQFIYSTFHNLLNNPNRLIFKHLLLKEVSGLKGEILYQTKPPFSSYIFYLFELGNYND